MTAADADPEPMVGRVVPPQVVCRHGLDRPGRPPCSCPGTAHRDDLGIVRLASTDRPWPGIPPALADAVANATSADQVVSALTTGEHRLPARQQQHLLHPAGGAAAVLAPLRPGTTALDFATGWSMLPSALTSLGATVVGVDWSYSRLRCATLLNEPPCDLAVHVAPDEPLPFADQSFDVVFADIPEMDRARNGVDPGSGQDREAMLAEVHRVLKDGGTAVIGTRNPLRAARGASAQPSGGGPGARGAARRLRRLLHVLGHPAGEQELARAGFVDPRVLAAHPRRGGPHWLVWTSHLREHLMAPRAGGSRAGGFPDVLRTTGARLGAGRWMVAEYYVVANRRPGPEGVRPPLYQSLEPFRHGETPLIRSLSDARVCLTGTTDFVKVPLSTDQHRGLVTEAEKTRAARGTAFAPFAVPSPRVEQRDGVPYTVYPLIRHRRDATAAEALAAIATALDAPVPAEVASLDTTAVWRRIRSARGQDDVAELAAEALHRAIVQGHAQSRVPVGPTHGDLHIGNVLLPPTGHPLLVDWNRFEPDNPLLLDATYAAVRGHVSQSGATLAEALLAFVDGELSGPLAERAAARLGDLGRLPAATLVLLDRIVSYSRPRRRYKPWTMGPLEEATRVLTSRVEAA
jgi:SAM-dependent methyltransferase